MPLVTTLRYRLTVEDGQIPRVNERDEPRWTSSTRKRETVTVASTSFTALTPPSTAVAVAIFIPSTAKSLTIKGVTGDTGIKVTPATNPIGCPVILPLGASVSIGIANADAASVDLEVQWL